MKHSLYSALHSLINVIICLLIDQLTKIKWKFEIPFLEKSIKENPESKGPHGNLPTSHGVC